jgi:hypothetical protein
MNAPRLIVGLAVMAVLEWPSPPLSAQTDATIRLLQELTNAHGVPGFEGPVRDILRREW